jgi:hypothetical protein
MSFYTNNLTNTLDDVNIYNTNIQNVTDYQLTQEYFDHLEELKQQAYNDMLKLICDRILKHFEDIGNDINLLTYDSKFKTNISQLKLEDRADLVSVLTLKGYTCEVVTGQLYVHS